jgi:hypothetical protein
MTRLYICDDGSLDSAGCHSVSWLAVKMSKAEPHQGHGLVWFGSVYLFIHSVTHVTLNMPITFYNLYITTQLIMYEHPPKII